jgi:hypothetical protein
MMVVVSLLCRAVPKTNFFSLFFAGLIVALILSQNSFVCEGNN